MIKKSLEENQEYILGELPGKFHEEFKAEMAAAPETLDFEHENLEETIKNELRYHPDIDETVVESICTKSCEPLPIPSEKEQKLAMEQELEKVKRTIETTS